MMVGWLFKDLVVEVQGGVKLFQGMIYFFFLKVLFNGDVFKFFVLLKLKNVFFYGSIIVIDEDI